MSEITLALENFFQLKATITSGGDTFAHYLLRNGEVVEKHSYARSRTRRFALPRAGTYRIKGYTRTSDGTRVFLSDNYRFAGFPDVPLAEAAPQIALLGVTPTSAFVGEVLKTNNEVTCYVDPTGEHVGKVFFGLPIVDTPPSGAILLAHVNAQDTHLSIDETYTLMAGVDDFLSRALRRFGAIDLYRIARRSHAAGLERGAAFLQGLIMDRFNCYIPHTASIGEGTRLGYGGVGTIIHKASIIGKDCLISQNVTLGVRAGGGGAPWLGDNVFVGPGAKCLGGRIGSNVVIGANAVVLKEVEDNCVVAGVPARVLTKDSSGYRGYTHRTRPGA